MTSISIRRATPADAAMLAELAATAFNDSFAADNSAENMAMYMEKAFGEEIQRAELHDPRNVVYIAERYGDVVGYTMLRDATPPDEVADTNALEIARLCSGKRAIGSGV